MEREMKISIAVMAHPRRSRYANNLYRKVERQKFYTESLVYDKNDNEWLNGVRSIRSFADSDWHVVIQDDVIIGRHFYENVKAAIESVPKENLISLYTGTVRPWPNEIKRALERADKKKASWLSARTLFWGVGIIIPTKDIDHMLWYLERNKSKLPYDQRIGSYYADHGRRVYYTNPSLVDHDYTIGSLIGNDMTVEPRKARNFRDELIMDWNKEVVKI